LAETIQKRGVRLNAIVDQTIGAAVFGGGRKAMRALKKLFKELGDE